MKQITLWILALWGLWCLIKAVIKMITVNYEIKPKLSIILLVKNWENEAEGLTRLVATKCFLGQGLFYPLDMVVIDRDSTDNTLEFFQKLARQFAFLKVYSAKDIKKHNNCIIDFGKERCQGQVVLLIDTDKYKVNELEKIIKFLL